MTTQKTDKPLAVLVGAGPGDPGLITAAALNWLAQADTVLYDRLANPSFLAGCRSGAELIYVGKGPGTHAMTQEQINELLVKKTAEGKLVVRLKGGDPLIFGRGGEEADALVDAGLPFRIVPGVTAAIAAGACAGIPLTDRRLASTVAFITGHEDPTKDESAVNYDALAGLDTLVFYMGVGNLPAIAGRLISSGLPADTPVALVQNATLPNQRTVVATLASAASAAEANNVRPPALLIVGNVVTLRQKLAWKEKLPLFGRTVLVTRTREQASKLTDQLAACGANVIECPTIEIHPPADFAGLDNALAEIKSFEWLVLTSPNGASGVLARMKHLGLDGRHLASVNLAAVGPATADVLNENFLHPDLMPETFTTKALGKALAAQVSKGRKVLLARADIATNELPDILRAAGADVVEAVAYRTVRPAGLPEDALRALSAGKVDWVTFTSSSTAENFLALVKGAGVDLAALKLASIGPVTTETLAAAGLTPTVEAKKHTIPGLVRAILTAPQ
jgi:uroporphyrinogen III methyltransferase/synthase